MHHSVRVSVRYFFGVTSKLVYQQRLRFKISNCFILVDFVYFHRNFASIVKKGGCFKRETNKM